MTKFRNLVSTAALALSPMLATASPISIDVAPGGLFGDPALYSDVRIDGDNMSRLYVRAGGFNVVTSNDESFVAWCIDLAEYLKLPNTYTQSASPFTSMVTENLSRLFTGFVEQIDTGVESAAFQVAIWELISDDNIDLSSGEFLVASNEPVKTQAQSYLDDLSIFDANYDLDFYLADGTQDLLTGTPSPVPLPAAGLLLLGGLGALGFGFRRSQKS